MCSAGRFQDALLLAEQWAEEQREREGESERGGGEELEDAADSRVDAGLTASQIDHVRVR